MANFIHEKYNSLPEQVEENMKNIKILENYIKEAFKSTVDLSDTSITVAISDTNANVDTTDGWLISQDGYLYKITGGDGVNLLIEFYARIKGDTGATGSPGDPTLLIDDNDVTNDKTWSSDKISNELIGLIDDNSTLINKTWSSDKISQIISYVKDKGIFASSNTPTLDGGNLYYEDADLLNPSSPNPPRYSDLIIYIDGNGKTKYLYQVTGVSGDETKYYVSQIAEFGGKKLYLNNIYINSLKWTSGDTRYYIGTIILILDVQFTTASDFINWYAQRTSDVVCDGIGMGYGSGYISHLRKLRVPSIVTDKVVAKFDIIHNLNGSVVFTDNQASSTFLNDQDIRVESREL